MDRLTLNFKLFLAGLALITLVGLCVHRADAATLDGTFAYPTKYVTGADLPLASIKHVRVEVGTCAGTAFGTLEGSQFVAPPATTFAVTVPRAFGDFCMRAQAETTLGNISDWTGVARKTIAEPKPNPPVFVTINAVVYEAKIHPTQGLFAGRKVGTVALGAKCYADANGLPYAGADLYRVTLATVDLNKTPRSELLLAQCEPRS